MHQIQGDLSIWYFFPLLFIMGCQSIDRSELENIQKLSPGVKIYFSHPVYQSYVVYNSDSTSNLKIGEGDIHYYDYIFFDEFKRFDKGAELDSLILDSIPGLYFELIHSVRHENRLTSYIFYICKGDSVVFTYDEGKPLLTSLKNIDSTNPNELAYIVDSIAMDSTNWIGFSSAHVPWSSIEREEQIRRGKEILLKEKEILDSLFQNGTISDKYYNFYVVRNRYLRYYHNQVLEDHFQEYKFPDSITRFLYFDDLLPYKFYRQCLNKRMLEELDINEKIEVGGSFSMSRVYDPKMIFDHVAQHPDLDQHSKAYLLDKQMRVIIKNYSVTTIEEYFTRMESAIKNQTYTNRLKKKFGLDFEHSNEMQLVDTSGIALAFEDVLERNKGNILYVDFWASWCAPCRREFSFSSELMHTYNNQDIKFIYLSIDDDVLKWKEANNKEKLSTDSYLITNYRVSRMMEDLHIQTIPRYLLYDKSGQLAHQNAPRPSSPELNKLLDQYLRE